MMNSDDVTTIVPDRSIPDDEARSTAAFVEAVQAAKYYQCRIAEARQSRGVDCTALEEDRDTLTNLEGGYTRALGRRVRDLGVLARARGGR